MLISRFVADKSSVALLVCVLSVLGVLDLAGCAVVPKPIVQQPMTAMPKVPALADRAGNGSIFQTGAYRPLFEDVRARAVGDSLIITISENTTTSKTAANSSSKAGGVNFAAPSLLGATAATTGRLNLATTSNNSQTQKGAASSGNTFTGTIAVNVIEVLSNGNLVVSGEKQIAFDQGAEFVRFSGLVSPSTIATGNTVASTQVANAKFEYRSNTHVDSSDMMSMLTRYFLSFAPM
jgi:flagellar L-ring protein precursor FlgH